MCFIVLHSCESKCFQRLHFVLPIFGVANWRCPIDNVNFSYTCLKFTRPKAFLLIVVKRCKQEDNKYRLLILLSDIRSKIEFFFFFGNYYKTYETLKLMKKLTKIENLQLNFITNFCQNQMHLL